jgi:predicted O-methyltransferase YrrM
MQNLWKKYDDLWEKLAPNGQVPTNLNSGMTQRKNEIIELWQLFDRLDPKIILEIGVSQGGTFASWCQLARDDALIIGIDRDPNDCWPREGNQIHPDIADPCFKMTEWGGGMYALKRKGSHQTVIAIRGMSYDPKTLEELHEVLDGQKIDFLFHDASHLYDMVSKDFSIYWSLIAPGGIMAFHDISLYTVETCDKYKWWREIRDSGPQRLTYAYEIPDRMNLGMGIGVLFKGEE